MGGRHSKSFCPRPYNPSSYTPSAAWDSSSYGPSSEVPPETYSQPVAKQKLQRRYSRIADNYNSLDEVVVALAQAGLESSNLIVGIDFTKSNEWTGARYFNC